MYNRSLRHTRALMTQSPTRAPDMQVNTDHISKKLTEAGFADPRTNMLPAPEILLPLGDGA
jgi:hypothetical protein